MSGSGGGGLPGTRHIRERIERNLLESRLKKVERQMPKEEPLILRQYKTNDEQLLARALVTAGSYLYGYCCGYFGRDSYGTKKVIKVGKDAVTVQNDDGSYQDSYRINDWVSLVKASNASLEELEREEARGDSDET